MTETYTPAIAAPVLGAEAPAPKKRGRPKRSEQVKRQRRRRKGLGREADMKLTVPEDVKEPGYEYRWIRNEPGRVRRLTIEDDYDLVPDETVAQDGDQAGLGIIPERHGGTRKDGSAYNMVLARKPKDFYEDDQKEKQSEIDETEAQLRRGATPAQGQQHGISDQGDVAYTPKGAEPRIDHGREG